MTYLFWYIPYCFCNNCIQSLYDMPCCFSFLANIIIVAWHCIEASIFCWKPPAYPDCFVTIYFALVCLMCSTFISFEKGPCIQMICFAVSPLFWHAVIESTEGNTRAYTLSEYWGSAVNLCISLLPVVSNIFPSVFFK